MQTSETFDVARSALINVIAPLATLHQDTLNRLKAEAAGWHRSDFIWHYLLQSFSTMGRASGWHGLIGNQDNYSKVTFEALQAMDESQRLSHVQTVCHSAKVRMPDRKAEFICKCYEHVQSLGGPKAAKEKLVAANGRNAKLAFLQTFPGIGPKYARNIMMDVYHEDFRDSIAIDVRIKAISELLQLTFANYQSHEQFYLGVARDAGLNGWELDRLLFNFRDEVESGLRRILQIDDAGVESKTRDRCG